MPTQTSIHTTPNVTPVQQYPVTLGSDPELLVFNGDRQLHFGDFLNKRANGDIRTSAGTIGRDGASSTGELRPKPTKDPATLSEQFRGMFTKLHSLAPDLDFTTLSVDSPVGGHIHLGFRDPGVSSAPQLTTALGSFLIPILMGDHRVSSIARRSGGSYGSLTDVRFDSRANGWHSAEVRGLNAEWLTTEQTTRAVFGYLAVVWNEILKHGTRKTLSSNHILRNAKQVQAVHEMFLSDYKPLQNFVVRGFATAVKKFELYPMFKEECDLVLNPKQMYKLKEAAGWNPIIGWKIQEPKKKAVLKKDILRIGSQEQIDRDNDEENQPMFGFNDDYRVTEFAQLLQDQVIQNNWRLDHQYFFYGLKKGVEGFAAHKYGVLEKPYMLPTKAPRDVSLQKTFERMQSRAGNMYSSSVRIDPKTGKVSNPRASLCVVGIPYNIRADRTTKGMKTFLEFIWRLESNKLSPKAASSFQIEKYDLPSKKTEEDIQESSHNRAPIIDPAAEELPF